MVVMVTPRRGEHEVTDARTRSTWSMSAKRSTTGVCTHTIKCTSDDRWPRMLMIHVLTKSNALDRYVVWGRKPDDAQ